MVKPSDLFSTDRERRAERAEQAAAQHNYPAPVLPFSVAQPLYTAAGLRAIPVHDSPPSGYQTATPLQLEQYAADPRWADAQTALHLSSGFVVLDDDYPERAAQLEAEHGERPATLYSTSRGAESARRKSLYRVPEGSRFGSHYSNADGVAGDVIDSIHRFMFVCPTLNRKTGEPEQWYAPDGTALERFPTAADLSGMVADLPEAWVSFLTSAAPENGSVGPYDGPTVFRGGELSERVQAVADRHPDTSHYPELNSALYDLAWTAVRFPDEPGIATLRGWFNAAYVERIDTRKPIPQRQASADRAWNSALATQAARYADDPDWEDISEGDPRAEWWSARAEPKGWDAQNQEAYADLRADAAAAKAQAAAVIPESWMPRDVTPYLEEGYEPPRPDVLRRADGRGLFYRGAVNEVHGTAGNGKTRLALAAVAEALGDGERVLYLNYEEPDARLLPNLRQMGADVEAIRERFTHLRPDEAPTNAALRWLVDQDYALVVIDTVGESIQNVTGGDSNSTDDVTVWHRFARAFANAGACVLAVDHITKAAADEGGSRALMPIGSQAKYAGYKGAVYFLEPSKTGGLRKGAEGSLRLILAKDNGGGLELAKGELAGTFHVDSRDPQRSVWHVSAPLTQDERAEAAEAQASADDWAKGREILKALEDAGEPISTGALRRALGYTGRNMSKHQRALDALVKTGKVTLSPGANSATLIGIPTPSPSPHLLGVGETGDSAVQVSPSKAAIPSPVRAGDSGDSARYTLPETIPVKSSEAEPSGDTQTPRNILSGVSDAELDALLSDEEDTPEPPRIGDEEWQENLARLKEQADHIFGRK